MPNNHIALQGKIANHDEIFYGQIMLDSSLGIIDQVIKRPDKFVSLQQVDMVYGNNCIIFPGFIDLHVHAREDPTGQHNYKEDFGSVSRAAINGGVTAIACMPNTPDPPINIETYEKHKKLAEKSLIPVLLYGGISSESRPIGESGRGVPYKVFLGKTTGNIHFEDYELLDTVLKEYAGCHVSFHCEDPFLLEAYANRKKHGSRRPPECEEIGIQNCIFLSDQNEIHQKICHVSTKKGLELCLQNKTDFEITPHHLYFNTQDMRDDSLMTMNPPLRSEKNRKALLDSIKLSSTAYLAHFGSDHAPHTLEDKKKGAAGVPQEDTAGPFVTWLIQQKVSLENIARIFAYNPGIFYSRFDEFKDQKFGKIGAGYVASLTVLNLKKPQKIKNYELKTKCAWSPFEGITFPGRVEDVYVRGVRYERGVKYDR